MHDPITPELLVKYAADKERYLNAFDLMLTLPMSVSWKAELAELVTQMIEMASNESAL